jgi:hypothetical protein
MNGFSDGTQALVIGVGEDQLLVLDHLEIDAAVREIPGPPGCA